MIDNYRLEQLRINRYLVLVSLVVADHHNIIFFAIHLECDFGALGLCNTDYFRTQFNKIVTNEYSIQREREFESHRKLW